MDRLTQKRLDLARVNPALQDFILEADLQLQKNDCAPPGWWHETDSAFLFVKLLNEVDELQYLFSMKKCDECAKDREVCAVCSAEKPFGCDEKVISIALLCFMLWDKKS